MTTMGNSRVLITDLQYFASVNWYIKVYNHKDVIIDLYEGHSKMSFRNRLWLAGGDGRLTLSVPVSDARNEKQLYRDLKIVPGRWPTEHLRAIISCYNRSPWFEYYRDELADLYSRPFQFLIDWNFACFEWMEKCLGKKVGLTMVDLHNESEIQERFNGAEMVDERNQIRPSILDRLSGNQDGVIRYRQVFEDRVGFIPGLSILDLLFCVGPAANEKLAG